MKVYSCQNLIPKVDWQPLPFANRRRSKKMVANLKNGGFKLQYAEKQTYRC